MRLPGAFIENIQSKYLFTKKDLLIVAVSGGQDSMALAQLCHDAGYVFEIAHCNFQLRGDESERDEKFVVAAAAKWNVKLHLKRFNTSEFAVKNKISIQEAARILRYEWFDELVGGRQSAVGGQEERKVYLLTAHHADDNVEWVLMNFFRGTGLEGLKGMPEKRDYIRRPLLEFSKNELVAYADSQNLQYVEDSSNADSKYTRNLFRNEIIPLLVKSIPGAASNVNENIRRFKDINELYKLAVGQITRKICKVKGEEVHIPVKQLLSFQNRALIYEIIHPFGFTEKQVDEVLKLTNAQSGSFLENEGSRIIRHRHWLIIAPKKTVKPEFIVVEERDQRLEFGVGSLSIENSVDPVNSPNYSNRDIALLDAKEIRFPMILRKWKAGDYFYPLGMPKKKKLGRFFIDQKLSKTEKEKVWVLESDRRIIWLPGMRIDDRFKITFSTKKAIRLTVEWKELL